MVISLAVCSRGRSRELRALLEYLLPLRGGETGIGEIIVVENVAAGGDGVGPIDKVVYVDVHEEIGFGAMRQLAVERASGDILVFLDDDCLPCAGWLTALVAPFRDAGVAAVGGGFIPQPAGAVAMATSLLGLPGGGFPRLCQAGDAVRPSRDLSNGNLALRRSAVEQAGGYDVDMTAGGEDSDLILRLPGKALFAPTALVAHRNRSGWLAVWRWFYRRGSAVAHYSRVNSSAPPLFSWRKSALLKLVVLTALAMILPLPLVALLAAGYYAVNVFRVARYSSQKLTHSEAEATRLQARRLLPLLTAPLLRLWMDAAFEAGLRRGAGAETKE